MRFPYLAMDCQEKQLTIDLLCGINGKFQVIDASCGWAVINVGHEAVKGGSLLVAEDGKTLRGSSGN